MNSCVLIGRIVRDVELKFTPGGTAVAKFTLAVDKGLFGEKKQQAENEGKPTADFINITVFNKQAENCANYLSKGSQCGVQGRISTGSYTAQDGAKRYTTEIVADRVEFLSRPEGQTKPQGNFEPEEDVFTPMDNSDEDIPF